MDEFDKLHEMLINAKIPHIFRTLDSEIFGENARQIRIYSDNTLQEELDDVIFHNFSYGSEFGLLETFHLGKCEGFETAKQVFEGWMKTYFHKTPYED